MVSWEGFANFLGSSIKFLFHAYFVYLVLAFAPDIYFHIEPNSYNVTLPETFDGPLRANNRLSQIDHLFVNEIIGPESLAIWKGDVFTGLSDGRIVRIRNDRYKSVAQFGDPKKCGEPWNMEKCGRPLGLRFDSKGILYVADAYYGLHTVNVTSGKVTRIMTSKKLIDDRKPKFLDDLVINEEENAIYFTDSSNKWDLKHVFYTVGEHDESGRVIRFDMKTKNSSVIMKSLGFPNGIELTDDKTALLVCEFNNRRIMKHYIDGEKRGQTDIFAYNLPGEPDNIRRSSDPYRESYWVGLMMGRNDKNPSFALDLLSVWPKTRKALLRGLYFLGFAIETIGTLIGFRPLIDLGFKTKTGHIIMHTIAHYGLALELDAEGKVLQSLHSPDGRTTLLSEVREVIVGDRKVLYFGSYANNYIGKVTLGHLAHLNRPLLTHDKKQYIEQQKKRNVKKVKPDRYVPYQPFDLQNPQFGPPQQKQNQRPDFDYDLPKPQKPPKSRKKTKKKSTSKKTKTKPKTNETNTSTKQKISKDKDIKLEMDTNLNIEPQIVSKQRPEESSDSLLNKESKPNLDSNVGSETTIESDSKPQVIKDSELGEGFKSFDNSKNEL